MLRLALAIVVALAALFEWLYGTYCWIQAFRYRKPNLPHYGFVPTDDQLTPRGRQYVRKWIWSWAAGVGLSVALSYLIPDAA